MDASVWGGVCSWGLWEAVEQYLLFVRDRYWVKDFENRLFEQMKLK